MIHLSLVPSRVVRRAMRVACACELLSAAIAWRADAQVDRGRWATLQFENGTLVVDSRSDHRVEISISASRDMRALFDPAAVSTWGSATQRITSDAHVAATYTTIARLYRSPVLSSPDGMTLAVTCATASGSAACRFSVRRGARVLQLEPALPADDVIQFALMMQQAGGYASLRNWFGSDTARSQYATTPRGAGRTHPEVATAPPATIEPLRIAPTHALSEANRDPLLLGEPVAVGAALATLQLDLADSTIRIRTAADARPIAFPVDTLARWLASLRDAPLDAPAAARAGCVGDCAEADTVTWVHAANRVRGLERASYGYVLRRTGEELPMYDLVLADGPGDWNLLRERGTNTAGVRALAARLERATDIAACVLRRPAPSSAEASGATSRRLASMAVPAYPSVLREKQIEASGTVRVQFRLDALGRVEPATIAIVASPSPHFSASVCAALLDARLSSTSLASRPARTRVEESFTIRP